MKKQLLYFSRRERDKDIFIAAYSISQANKLMREAHEWCNEDYIRNFFQDPAVEEEQEHPLIIINGEIKAIAPVRILKGDIKYKTKFNILCKYSVYSKKNGAVPKRRYEAKGLSKEEALLKMKELTGKSEESVVISGGVFPKHYSIV